MLTPITSLLASILVVTNATAAAELAASLDKNQASMNDPVTISVSLVNTSDVPLVFYGRLLWGHSGGLVLTIKDQQGEVRHSWKFVDEKIVPKTLREGKNFVTLRPSHFFGARRTETLSDLVPGPGEYTLEIEYCSPVPRRYYPVEGFFGRESGCLVAPPIHLTVEP